MASAKAIRVHAYGGPEALRWEAVEVGEPGPGEALVRHTRIGVNFTDLHHRTGRYPSASLPVTIGVEAAGVVEAVGDGVVEVSAGQRVAYGGTITGADTELRVMPVQRLVPLPDWLDDELAAAAILKGLTAQYLLRGAYRVQPGETVLVHAAAGGVGQILCQWARHLGARVIGTTSTEEKAEIARANGCAEVVLYGREDVAARVRALTDGAGVQVVYDSVGASTFEASLSALKRRGTAVSFGSASGPVPPLELFRLNRMGSLHVTSAGLADYTAERPELLERAADLFAVLRDGAVRVSITRRYPLADAAEAHRDIEARRTTGSLLLVP